MHLTIPALLALSFTTLGFASEAVAPPVFACNNQVAMCCNQADAKNPKTCVHGACRNAYANAAA